MKIYVDGQAAEKKAAAAAAEKCRELTNLSADDLAKVIDVGDSDVEEEITYERKPVVRTGHGIPLFSEPMDDFPSGESSDEDDSHFNYRPLDGPKLSFEELWMLNLKGE